MKTLWIYLILVTALILAADNPSMAQSPGQIYQKGLMKEEGEGALQDAIDLYKQIADNSTAEQSLRAKALLHIGMCYEKLGAQEAVNAYKRLVNNFPDQKSEVAIARERLSRLVQLAEEVSNVPLVPKFTKVNIPTNLPQLVALSPDGKNLSLVSENKLWKIPLSGNLGPDIPGIPEQINTEGVLVSDWPFSWSLNGKWIAFYGNPPLGDGGNVNEHPSIYVVSSDGGKPKKVIENVRDVQNDYISLSTNGNNLAFSSVEENKQHIFSTPVDKVFPRQIVEMEACNPVFSPDGKYIAFSKGKNEGIGEDNPGLWVVEANGGKPYKLADADDASCPIWSPDGKLIAFHDFSLFNQIRIVPFSKTANTSDKVIRIEAPGAVRGLTGWTHDNKIGALTIKDTKYGLYTLPVEGGQAAKILQDGMALQPRWSKNCEQIYYVTYPEKGTTNGRGYILASVSASGGNGKPLKTNYKGKLIKQLGFISGNKVSPDGKWIVTSTWTQGDPNTARADTSTINVDWPTSKIWKVSVDGEDAIQVTNTPGNFFDSSPCWSADGKEIAYVRTELNEKSFFGDSRIYIIDSNGGEPELLDPNPGISPTHLIWSPDGKKIAYTDGKKFMDPKILKIIDVESRDIRVFEELPEINMHTELVWSPDSKRIAFNAADGKVIKIMNIDDGSIEDIKTGLPDVRNKHLDWSPDGKRFVFGGRTIRVHEFWFMENFLPLEQLAQKEETKEPEGIVIKQVWTGSEADNSGSISQDGKYLSFVDWDTGDLALRNLNTKQNSRLVPGNWDTPMQYAQYSVISPNGKQIAYQWHNKKANDLYLINIDNPIPKLLYGKEGVSVLPHCWLSDNEIIIGIYKKEADAQIGSYNILDGTIEIFETLKNPRWLTSSPDGKYIAYDFRNESQGGTTDINILSTDGKGEITLVEHPANDAMLGWMPERNEFLFVSDRSGTWDLWAIAVDNGKPLGQERLIYTDIGEVGALGFTKNGDCFIEFSNRNFNAYILPVNKLTGKPEGKPEIHLAGSIYSKNWSPDGKYMARVQEGNGSFELIIRDVENGNDRRLAEELYYVLAPYWSRDRQSVYIFGMDKKMLQTKGYKGGIFTVDLKSNIIKENLLISDYNYTPSEDDALPISAHVVSDDGKYIYMLFQNDWIVKHDLNNGQDTILYRHPKFVRGVLQLSPDGNKLLFAIQNKGEKMSRLLTISTQGGDEKELCTSQESNISGSAFWSPDSKYVYFSERAEGTNLWRVDAKGGKPEKVWKTDKGAESFIMHPSGEKISYSVRERTTEIRVIEGLNQELEKIDIKEK